MPYVRDSFWRGREFASLPQMQAEAARWSLEVAGHRQCRPLEGAAPAVVFEAVEKDTLRPLPGEPFVLATWATAKIGPDIHAQVEKVLYSVPWRHIGKTADVRITGTMVQFFIGGQLVKSHPRKVRGKQTDFGDYLSGGPEVPVHGDHEPGPDRQGPQAVDQPVEGCPERLRHHLRRPPERGTEVTTEKEVTPLSWLCRSFGGDGP